MKQSMTKLQKFIRLQVEEELSKDDIKKWRYVVEVYGPKNNVLSVPLVNPKGGVTEVSVIHRKYNDGKHTYDVPLKRDLLEKEVLSILEQWKIGFDKDFVVESSENDIGKQKEILSDAVILTDESYKVLCEAIAKSQHQIWMNERMAQGWSYGAKMNQKEKTHPMLKAWHDLPDEYRKIDETTPQMFIEELNKAGFSVVKTSDFDMLKQ